MTNNRKSTLTIIAAVSAMVASVAAFLVTEATAQFHNLGGAQRIRGHLSLANEPAEGIGSPLNRAELIETFDDEFSDFRWYAEGAIYGKPGGGIWRTNFGYAGVQDRNSRNLPSNGEQQIYVDRGFRGTAAAPLGLDPFRINDGVLEITADRTPDRVKPYIWNYEYTSGLITSRDTFSQRYGVFEVRARVPKGRGLWSCIWLLPAAGGWPPEIDILEILGDRPTTLVTTWHSAASGEHTMGPVATEIPDASADFHTYAIDWDADQIRWYFDGFEVAHAQTPADMHVPMYLLMNLAVGGNWPGSPDTNTQFPAALSIDWIRAYQRPDLKTK
jgi:beta-glucanase (GH16 family)